MKKAIIIHAIIVTILLNATPVFAEVTTTSGVGQIQTFVQSVIQVLVTMAGMVSVGFFVWGGFGYITSSGNPESLDRSKKTILYSAVGLTIVLGSFVLSSIVTQLATAAFGAAR